MVTLCTEMLMWGCATLTSPTPDIVELSTTQHSSGQNHHHHHHNHHHHQLKLKDTLLSPNEARILSRKPQAASKLFLALKPFSPLLWALFVGVFVIFFFLFLFFIKINQTVSEEKTVPYQHKDFFWMLFGVGIIYS